mmetsp:Transcript_21892/g.44513  ORF Transcript_21892/g.44513 Transcript_21892/m.44513 type:complete len:806 (+) Transcript_21892:69-2486(+)|eukprot:CAMPEP_0196722046 /NCGR_PEP_ID=MMETSP1091-20130531/4473_1 /TAXON_ID=302021 /ORGANISM="Rhodomonas sp., Strain CCMP768" /LENGTH=805 /DNA_ID=CAMNT_0042063647 /DNA_START=80 /DNA_END=2497 /DNA_ORIENTATION=+
MDGLFSLFFSDDVSSDESFSSSFFRRGKGALPKSDYTAGEHVQCWLTFFMVMLASRTIAPLFQKIGFPTLTGNVVVGAICGPYVLGIVAKDDVNSLGYINLFALAYITTAAGAELVVEELKKSIVIICTSVGAVAVLIFAAVSLVTKSLANTSLSTFTHGMTDTQQWSVAMIMGGLAVTGSPAAAVAVVRELQSKGKMTATFLGILMMIDVVVLIMMPMLLANADAEFTGVPFKAMTAGIVIATLIASCLLGIVVAYAYQLVMKIRIIALHALVFPIGFLVFVGCALLAELLAYHITEEGVHVSFEPLLMCMVGGFITVNYSKYHHRFVEALEHAGPTIFLPFFTLVGASLDLVTFAQALPFAIILSLVRMVCIFFGTAVPSHLLGESKQFKVTLWMTQISQAGFSLGLAAQIGTQFPGWGEKFQAVIISCVVVNQMIGPLMCKYALKKAGEAGRAITTDEEAALENENDPDAVHVADENKAVIIGVTPRSKAVAFSLLKKRWGVTMLAASGDEASGFRNQVYEWADNLRKEYMMKHGNSTRHLDPSAAVLHHETNFKAVLCNMPDLDKQQQQQQQEGSPGRRPSLPMGHPSSEVAGERFGGAFGDEPQGSGAQMESVKVEGAGLEMSVKPPQSTAGGSKAGSAELEPGSCYEGNEGPAKSLEDVLARGTSFDMLLPPGSFESNMQAVGIHDVLDNTDHLRTVVVALDSDQAALSLVKMLQTRWGHTKASKVRVVVLIQDPESAAAVAELGAVSVNDFVALHSQALLAAVTPYEKDAILVHATANQAAWADAYLGLFAQKAWSME